MTISLSERLAVLPQYLLPQQALTALAGRLAAWQGGAVTTAVIRRFVARYGVDMAEAAQEVAGDLVQRMQDDLRAAVQEAVEQALIRRG